MTFTCRHLTCYHYFITRHLLTLADGGQLAMDWLNMGTKNDDDHPVLVILPGLTG